MYLEDQPSFCLQFIYSVTHGTYQLSFYEVVYLAFNGFCHCFPCALEDTVGEENWLALF